MTPHIHTIHHHHFGWDNSLTPDTHAAPGDTLAFTVQDASGGQLTEHSSVADLAAFDFSRTNPVNGPVYIDGAEPGDALKVEVLDFQEGGWGWTGLIPGFGLLADEFPDPWLHLSRYDREAVQFTPEIRLPTRPFTGTIGVAPAEPGLHSVVPPRRVGGNLDIRDLTRGSTLYLPVEVPGALFSVGDTHACQGDGEVCGTAVETAMTVQLRFSLIKGANFSAPRFEVPASGLAPVDQQGYYATTGIGPDLYRAAQDAIRAMIDHLGREYRLDPPLAYALCSVAVDLKISEIVDAPNWLVSAYLPRSIFR
ncbi:acetamidase/formamidase family protein [Deinococcus sonorensis]|uniref:Acetamidase/formamidase family protein n=2 Tax=Deinococcus sonorensis TaxID=309891 RepID=A0AAU7UFU6_9DEIO